MDAGGESLSSHPTNPGFHLPAYLTDQQREAITYPGSPLLILAGPGSGKTEVIAWRAAYLVRAHGVDPAHLLVTTFTEKAALELKDRVQEKLPGVNCELMQISTLHSFCALLLRRFPQYTPLETGFRVLDETGQFLFVYTHRRDLGLADFVKGREHDFYQAVIAAFNLATEELVDPADLAAWCHENQNRCLPDQAGQWEEYAAVARAYARYLKLLTEARRVDFALLQRHAIDLLQGHPPVLEAVRQQHRHVLVDEFQDTNAAQGQLLALIVGNHGGLTVVGDDDQSIYRFRGATVKNLLSFPERYPQTHTVTLAQNFRSVEPIVAHSQKVIAHNPARYDKALFTMRGTGSDLVLVYEKTAAEEATAVTRLLQDLHARGVITRFRDVAILLRSVRSYAGPYIEALRAAGIPHHVVGDASFFARPEITQLYQLFNFLGATKSWGDRFLRAPLVGLTEDTNRNLAKYKGNLLEITDEAGLEAIGVSHPGDRQKLLALLNLKRRVQAGEHSSLLEVTYDLLAAAGCTARFEREENGEALANLGLMSQLVAAWDEDGGSRNFYPFQHYLKLLKEGGVDPAAIPPEDAVQVMTIHQAKGLEFPVVVLGAAMNGRLPATRRRKPYEIPAHLRASGGVEAGVRDPHLVDERKLFYVAATRARDLLIIGTADVVNKRGGGPSQFLYEMFGDDLRAASDVSQARIRAVESHRGAPAGPRPRYSFSQLLYYLQCPLRYKFTQVYGFQVPWQDPADFGANVHRALQALHQKALAGEQVAEQDVPALVADSWVPSTRMGPAREAQVREAAVRQIQRYVREHRESLARVQQAETPFSFGLGARVLLGKIDLVRRVEGADQAVEIVDFKTSASKPLEAEHIDLQLDLYAMGVEAARGLDVQTQAAHFLGDGVIARRTWTPARRQQAHQALVQVLARIEAQAFAPNLSYCSQCREFQAICAYADKAGQGEAPSASDRRLP